MELTFAPKDFLQIDNARITHRNFRGEGSMYNREGDRNFSLVIEDQELAEALIERGWNVKIKPPREEGDTPFMFLPIKVSFNERGPAVYLKTGNAVNKLDEDSLGVLDEIDILAVDLDIRPYDWGPINGKYGRSAYLQSIHVTQRITDRFAARYND